MGAGTGTGHRKCCDCGEEIPPVICTGGAVGVVCSDIQQFARVQFTSGPFSGGDYLCFYQSGDLVNTFTRIDSSDGTTVTLKLSDPYNGGFFWAWDLYSLVVTDGVDTFTADTMNCSSYTILMYQAFRCVPESDLSSMSFSVSVSGVANDSSTKCECGLNRTETCTYLSSSGTAIDGFALLPFTHAATYRATGSTTCTPDNGFVAQVSFSPGTNNNCPGGSCHWEAFTNSDGNEAYFSAKHCTGNPYVAPTLKDVDPFSAFSWSGPWDHSYSVVQCDYSGASYSVSEL